MKHWESNLLDALECHATQVGYRVLSDSLNREDCGLVCVCSINGLVFWLTFKVDSTKSALTAYLSSMGGETRREVGRVGFFELSDENYGFGIDLNFTALDLLMVAR